MTTVNRVGSAPLPSRTTDLLRVKVTENDATLKAVATTYGFKVTGRSTIIGTKPSVLSLSFDNKTLSLRISRGDTGEQMFAKLKAALPKGYEARLLQFDKSLPPQVTMGIAKKGGGASKVDAAKIPMSISANMASASVESSFWVNLMPGRGSPRPNAIAKVSVSGTGFADAPPKFTVKSISVYEKGTNKLVATVNNPRLVDSEIRRGTKTQNYRLEVPKKDLDMGKQYTFVVNTGINGSSPARVRSEYVAIDKVY
jgi:hypothetical protein